MAGIAERIERTFEAGNIALDLALVVDRAERQVSGGGRHGDAGHAGQARSAERLERIGVAGHRHRHRGTAGGVVGDAGRQVRAGVEVYLLVVVRSLDKGFDTVSDFVAQPAEYAPTVVLRHQADATAGVIDLPRSALDDARMRGAVHAAEGGGLEHAIVEDVHRAALAEIQAAQRIRRGAGRCGDQAARRRVRRADLAQRRDVARPVGAGCRPGRILDPHIAGMVPSAIDCVDVEDAVLVRNLGVDQDMTAAAGE